MSAFSEFLKDATLKGEPVNTLFEERLFDLVGVLHKITETLTADGVPHELIGGLAVLVHVEEADPEHAMLTRDVDLMVRREDLERIQESAARDGLDIWLYGDTNSAKNTVHLIFSGRTG
jgi:hypothetical protein